MNADAQNPQSTALEPRRRGLHTLLACNPFYLLSPLLMIIGVDMLWRDVAMLSNAEHLGMNMLSLHLYELLLVGGAILLAKKKIWYDGTLLVTIECAFLFVPYVLLSSSDRLDMAAFMTVGIIGLVATVLKFGLLRAAFRGMMLSGSFLMLGFALLAFNMLLPATFAKLSREVYQPEAALESLEALWLFVLPLLVVVANLMPIKRPEEGEPLPARNWMPHYLYAIMMVVTGYHLWALGYMRDWQWSPLLVAPALWALAWTLVNLRDRLFPGGPREQTLAWLPLAVVGLAFSPRMEAVACGMMLINVVIFGARAYLRHDGRADAAKCATAILATIGMLPVELVGGYVDGFSRGVGLEWAAGLAMMVYALWTRKALPGLLASGMIYAFCDTLGWSVHVSAQLAFAFAIIHSLGWDQPDARKPVFQFIRAAFALSWVVSTLIWLHFVGDWWPVIGNVLLTLIVFGAAWLYLMWTTYDPPRVIVYAAVGNFVLHPIYPIMDMVMESGPAVWVLASAFLFFALGTIWALNKDTWMRPKPQAPTPIPHSPEPIALG
jgi:hypothetical protein